jgi:hypothetical protein
MVEIISFGIFGRAEKIFYIFKIKVGALALPLFSSNGYFLSAVFLAAVFFTAAVFFSALGLASLTGFASFSALADFLSTDFATGGTAGSPTEA